MSDSVTKRQTPRVLLNATTIVWLIGLLLAVVAILLWLRAWRIAQLETEIVQEIRAAGVTVHFDYEEFEYGYDPSQRPPPSRWYDRFLPDGGRPRVVAIELMPNLIRMPNRISDELFERIACLSHVKHLRFGSLHTLHDFDTEGDIRPPIPHPKIAISNRQLESMGRMQRLKVLDLTGTTTTDEGLMHFTRLKQLEKLWIRETNVTAAGVRKLQTALPKAEVFHSTDASSL